MVPELSRGYSSKSKGCGKSNRVSDEKSFMMRYRDTKNIKKRITELRGRLNGFKEKSKRVVKRVKKTLRVRR